MCLGAALIVIGPTSPAGRLLIVILVLLAGYLLLVGYQRRFGLRKVTVGLNNITLRYASGTVIRHRWRELDTFWLLPAQYARWVFVADGRKTRLWSTRFSTHQWEGLCRSIKKCTARLPLGSLPDVYHRRDPEGEEWYVYVPRPVLGKLFPLVWAGTLFGSLYGTYAFVEALQANSLSSVPLLIFPPLVAGMAVVATPRLVRRVVFLEDVLVLHRWFAPTIEVEYEGITDALARTLQTTEGTFYVGTLNVESWCDALPVGNWQGS